MAEQKEEVKPVSETGPTTTPKYFIMDRVTYGHLDNVRKTLDAMQGVTGGIGYFFKVPETALIIPVFWIIRYYLGLCIDKTKVKNPLP